MSLAQSGAEHQARIQKKLGEKYSLLADDIERLRATGAVDHALKVGELAPDFTLSDAFGNEVSLHTLLSKGPVVISFYRGEWCPFCNLELRALQEALPRIEEAGAMLIGISPEKPDHGIVATEKHRLTYPVLSDIGNQVARKFGIVTALSEQLKEFSKNTLNNDIALRNGEDSWELPAPATFIIDTMGLIRFAHVDLDYMTGRVEPETVVAALRMIPGEEAR